MDAKRTAAAALLVVAVSTGPAAADELLGAAIQGVGNILGLIFEGGKQKPAQTPVKPAAAQVQSGPMVSRDWQEFCRERGVAPPDCAGYSGDKGDDFKAWLATRQ